MSSAWKIFCLFSTFGGVTGLAPLITAAKSGSKTSVTLENVKRMQKYGVSDLKVCLVFKSPEVRSGWEIPDGKEYRVVFWFDNGPSKNCGGVKGKPYIEVSKYLKKNGYYTASFSSNEFNNLIERAKKRSNGTNGMKEENWNTLKSLFSKSPTKINSLEQYRTEVDAFKKELGELEAEDLIWVGGR